MTEETLYLDDLTYNSDKSILGRPHQELTARKLFWDDLTSNLQRRHYVGLTKLSTERNKKTILRQLTERTNN